MSIRQSPPQLAQEMPQFTTPELTRSHFVRYAGASNDFNPMHHDEEFAKSKGSPSVFGHGMLTAGILGQVIARWVGPLAVRSFRVRFSAQVWPKDVLTCGGTISKVYEETLLPRADLDCWVRNQRGETVLTGSAIIGPHAG